MKMHEKFNLKLSTNRPENGFFLDELVIESKKMFETEGIAGVFKSFINFTRSNDSTRLAG